MNFWTVTKDGILKRSNRLDVKIKSIGCANKLGHVLVQTNDGKDLILSISLFQPEGAVDLPKQFRTSRSIFLGWMKDFTDAYVDFPLQRRNDINLPVKNPASCSQVAVVEYTNERVFLGYIEDDLNMTFTKKPQGYLESFKFDDKCLEINPSDTMIINKKLFNN